VTVETGRGLYAEMVGATPAEALARLDAEVREQAA
jgi:hypothetical protein